MSQAKKKDAVAAKKLTLAVSKAKSNAPAIKNIAPPRSAGAPPIEAIVDGKRVILDAQDEIVLRCGQASITLRRNGRIVIRGTYVETHSAGVNRIKGGSVQIN